MAAPRLAARLAVASTSALTLCQTGRQAARASKSAPCPLCSTQEMFKRSLSRHTRQQAAAAQAEAVAEPDLDLHSQDAAEQVNDRVLLVDDDSPEVTLQSLDGAVPKLARRSRELSSKKGLQAQKIWEGIVDDVQNSFTLPQMRRFAAELGITYKTLSRERRAMQANSINKRCVARALVAKRFKLREPRSTSGSTSFGAQQILAIPLPLQPLQLLYLYGRHHSRGLFRQYRVSMRLARMDEEADERVAGEGTYGVILSGGEDGNRMMRAFVEELTSNVISRRIPLANLTASSDPTVPSREELGAISRHSRSLITIGEAPLHEVEIYSLNHEDAAEACMLLTSRETARRELSNRKYYTWSSPAIPAEHETSVPTFALLPHSAPLLQDALVQENNDRMRFRLTRQDLATVAQTWELKKFRDNVRLSSVDQGSRSTTLSKQTSPDADVVTALLQGIPERGKDESEEQTILSLRFGHLTFSEGEQGAATRSVAPTTPPIPGTWPLEYVSRHIRSDSAFAEADEDGQQDYALGAKVPVFSPSVPPLMFQVNKHSLASMVGARRKIMIFRRLLSSIEGKQGDADDLEELEHAMDWDSRQSEECLRVSYVNAEGRRLTMDFVYVGSDESLDHPGALLDDSAMPELHSQQQAALSPQTMQGTSDAATPSPDAMAGLDAGVAESTETAAAAPGAANIGYASATPLDAESNDSTSQNWKLTRATLADRREADVLVPEAAIDMRLSALRSKELDTHELLNLDSGISTFRDNLESHGSRLAQSFGSRFSRVAPPLQMQIEGSDYALLSTVLTSRLTWLVRPRAEEGAVLTKAERRIVLELEKPFDGGEVTAHIGVDYTKKGAIDLASNTESSNEEKQDPSEPVQIWQWLRRSAEEINKEPYRSVRGT